MKLNLVQIRKLKKLSIENKKKALVEICNLSNSEELNLMLERIPSMSKSEIEYYFNYIIEVANNGSK